MEREDMILADICSSTDPASLAYSETGSEITSDGSSEAFSLPLATRPAWVRQVQLHLQDLLRLSPNWDSYGASEADVHSLRCACEFVEFLGTFGEMRPPRVALTPDGFAALTWEWNDGRRCLDVEVRPDRSLAYALVADDDEGAEREGETTDWSKIATLIGR